MSKPIQWYSPIGTSFTLGLAWLIAGTALLANGREDLAALAFLALLTTALPAGLYVFGLFDQ